MRRVEGGEVAMLPIGAVLLVSRLGDVGSIVTCGGAWVITNMVMHLLRATSPQVRVWTGVWRKHVQGQKWRRFLQTMCGMSLSLSEGVRGMMVEAEDGVRGRLTLCVILLASMVTGCRMKEAPWQVKRLLDASAVTCLITFTYVSSHEFIWLFVQKDWKAYVWLMMALDFLISSDEMYVSVIVAALVKSNAMGAWSFVWGVFPCMCLWQREEWMRFHKVLSTMKHESVVYCLACVGTLALCGAIYSPCWQTVLATYCGLRWFGALSSCWCIGRNYYMATR